jgi:hypothetical protein
MVVQDDLLLLCLSFAEEQKNQKVNWYRILFDSADLNGDGYLQIHECRLLFRYLSKKPGSGIGEDAPVPIDFREGVFYEMFVHSAD